MSPAERRWAVRELFYKILRNEKIRIDFFRDKELPISSPIPTDQPLPRIDIQTLLAIVIIGIRNSNGGVLPIHVLNWIARGDLPFFTAHKHLEAPLERIEYYASTAAQGAYTQPAFSPISAPGIDELENLVETIIKTVGVPTKPCDPINLLKTSMNMLGLPSGVLEFGEQLLSATWFGMMVGGRVLFVANSNRRMGLRIHDSRTKRRSPYNVNVEDIIVADVSVYEYVAVHIIFIMKLLFPDLHLEHPPDDTNCEEIGKSKKFPGFYNLHASINGPIHYQIQSNRGHQFSGYPVKFGTIEFWDSMTIDEQEQLLSFIDNERLPELRECIVDKNVRDTIRNKSVESTVAADQEHPSVNKHNRITLISGPLSQYQMTDELLNLNGTLSFLIRDVMRACGCKDIVRISLILRDFEKRIFASKFKFTRGSRESRAPVSHNN
jgi:hypothetical protein